MSPEQLGNIILTKIVHTNKINQWQVKKRSNNNNNNNN